MRKILLLLLFFAFLHAKEIFATYDVVAKQEARLALQSSGVVFKIYSDVGDMVKKGDTLASLDTSSEEIALELANAALEFAKSSFEKVKNAKSVSSKQSFDEAKFNLAQAAIKVKQIQDAISKKRLIAPFDGVIAARFVEVGDGVGAISQPLFLLQSYPQVKLLIGVDSSYAFKVGLKDEFKFIKNGKEFVVKIDAIAPNINPSNQKFYLHATSSGLLVGDFGEGHVVIK